MSTEQGENFKFLNEMSLIFNHKMFTMNWETHTHTAHNFEDKWYGERRRERERVDSKDNLKLKAINAVEL